jgi:hypothetical protein
MKISIILFILFLSNKINASTVGIPIGLNTIICLNLNNFSKFIFDYTINKGILIHKNVANELVPMIEKLKEYINNGIKLGRHRWVFQIHLLDTLDEIELLNAGLNLYMKVFDKSY